MAFSRKDEENSSLLMGPILKRKKVVSMPLGAGGEFFRSHNEPSELTGIRCGHLQRQLTAPASGSRSRLKSESYMKGVLRRKQISLNLLGPDNFFVTPEDEEKVLISKESTEDEELAGVGRDEKIAEAEDEKFEELKLFAPLVFSPRVVLQGVGAKHDAPCPAQFGASSGTPMIDEETVQTIQDLSKATDKLKLQISSLHNKLDEEEDINKRQMLIDFSGSMLETQQRIQKGESVLKKLLPPVKKDVDNEKQETGRNTSGAKMENLEDEENTNIIRATTTDKIKAGIIVVIMLAFTVFVCSWHTHIDEESYLHLPVGLACQTPCMGNLETKDFFGGHNHFQPNQVISLTMHLDPSEEAGVDTLAVVEIAGEHSGHVKATTEMGPPDGSDRLTFQEKIIVDFEDPDEHHVINVYSSNEEVVLRFTLHASVQSSVSQYSVLVAALVLVAVYVFILIEVVHRTLVAIFGSMIALLFQFIMQGGETESIRQIMLHMEWSTLGLLFGMMLLVGELSHTGIFEWFAVRLVIFSRGSFIRLLVLLCVMTAITSAFLDNVTTMLLVAPVTIDMCNILEVDPRPYLLGEIFLSNIGGTATLIGDPPNIIIGSAFLEIGFVEFIIHVLPCIFLFCMPTAILVVLWIYRPYFTTKKMRALDTVQLKKAYAIYDEPRLLIAGTITSFVILIFFLHSVHHKDTAWIALFGAFLTITFTNPHDVQDALRNHVAWDTLLFFGGLFVLVEVCAGMGLLKFIGDALTTYIKSQAPESQLTVAITLIMWVSGIVSAFLDNIPMTITMIPVIEILADSLPETLNITTLSWALSFGACLGGNGTLLGASANIVTAGISTNKGFDISFMNFFFPGMLVMISTVAIANVYMLVRYAWV